MRSLRAARMVPLDDVPDELFMSELVMLEPVVLLLPLRVVLLLMPEDEVDGVVIVFASVERPVLGAVLPLDRVLPLLVVVPDDVVPPLPGRVVPVGEAVDDDGLVVDGLVLVVPDEVPDEVPGEVCAWARLTAPTRATIEAAVRALENFMRGLLFERLRKGALPGRDVADRASRPGVLNGNRHAEIGLLEACGADRVIGLQRSGTARKSGLACAPQSPARLQFFSASSASHEGEQTAWARPSTLRVFMTLRSRCLPHRKHDMVAPPKVGAALNGEPGVFDL